MSYISRVFSVRCLLFLFLLLGGGELLAQPSTPSTLPMTRQRDTSQDKSNNGKWHNEEARLTYEKLNSNKVYTRDTNLHTFQRRMFVQPWVRDQGNVGSPALNLLFTPDDRFGPSLGYHIFDVYRFNVDSAEFYNTNRPYSVFTYQMGGRQEQVAGIFHTQNILPNWNFMVDYRKINAPGYYKLQRNNHDNVVLTTNYKSLDKHYALYAAVVFNNEQHDENGGTVNDSELLNPAYNDRRTLDATYQSEAYSISRSSVFNNQRDLTAMLQHSYTWGRTDTVYDKKDTGRYTYHITPRFSITHKMELSWERHIYKDYTPDSMRYISLFDQSFANDGTGYYQPGGDSVYTQQKWAWVDNKIMFNGFVGKAERQLKFSAGAGVRYDQFISLPILHINPDSLPKAVYNDTGYERSSFATTYITGELKKEALAPGAWEYNAAAKLFTSGQYAGNFLLSAAIGKKLRNILGSFTAGFQQQINSAPYSYYTYMNRFVNKDLSFNNESVTLVYAQLESPRYRLSGGVRAYTINNYIYMAENELPAQYSVPFTIPQAWVRKVFKLGNFFIDNELVYQQVADNMPVNVPRLMGRHQFSYERDLFKRALRLASGIEVRYNDTYNPAGYNAQFNRFFYQKTTIISNTPELSVFLNFRIKRFRAFIMGDNLQLLLSNTAKNMLLYTGSPVVNFANKGVNYVPVYAGPDAMFRFGFSWAMVN